MLSMLVTSLVTHAAATVTLPVSIINNQTKNAGLAYGMLAKKCQLVIDLLKENTELKLRIKDLEATARPNQHQSQTITLKPPMSTVVEESYKKKGLMPPQGKTNKEKQEDTRQVN